MLAKNHDVFPMTGCVTYRLNVDDIGSFPIYDPGKLAIGRAWALLRCYGCSLEENEWRKVFEVDILSHHCEVHYEHQRDKGTRSPQALL